MKKPHPSRTHVGSRRKSRLGHANPKNTRQDDDTTKIEVDYQDDKPVNANQSPNKTAKPEGEKLQKLLARLGLGSRRGLEEIIKSGRITVNQKPATLGDRVLLTDEIRIDGRLIRTKAEREKRRRVIAYYKPEGEICSAVDKEGRPTVFERLPKLTGDRWVMVGRLDVNSSGLLLFTNDGELAHRLMHPSHNINREYAVRVLGELTSEMIRNLTTDVALEDGLAKFNDIKAGGGTGVNKWYHVSLTEGRKREVRRLFESQGLKVSRLLRTRFGSFKLPSTLKTGRFIELDHRDINELIALVGLRPRVQMGLNHAAREKQARIHKKPLKARISDQKRTRNTGNKSEFKPKKTNVRRTKFDKT